MLELLAAGWNALTQAAAAAAPIVPWLNMAQWQGAYNQQLQLTGAQMQREDTAVQRRVADLKAAGLNPVLAAGSAAQTGAYHIGAAPQLGNVLQPQLDQLEIARQRNEVGITAAQRDLMRTQAEQAKWDFDLTKKSGFGSRDPATWRLGGRIFDFLKSMPALNDTGRMIYYGAHGKPVPVSVEVAK